jgi:autotransporter-associated beta strand protein
MKPTASNRSNCLSKAFLIPISLALFAAMPVAQAANGAWTGTSNVTWATSTNWLGGIVPGGTAANSDIATFNSATYTNQPTAGSSYFLGGLVFDSGNSGGITITTGTGLNRLNIGSSGIQMNAGTGAVLIGASGAGSQGASITANQSWTNNSSSLLTLSRVSVDDVSSAATYTLTINGSGTGGVKVVSTLVDINAGADLTRQLALAINSTGGNTTLTSGNSYSGGTTLTRGNLQIGNNGALGNGTLSLNGGKISSNGTTSQAPANAVNIGGNATLGDVTNNGTLTFSGAIGLGNSTRVLTLESAAIISGVVSSGGLTKVGAGMLTLSGASANTYSGLTTINEGTLKLGKTAGVNAIAGDISVGDSASDDVLQLVASDQIADTSIISLNGNVTNQRGQLVLGGYNETIGGLSGNGLVQNTSSVTNSVLTLNVASATTQSSAATIRNTGTSSTGTLGIIKTGNGTQTLTGVLTYAGSTAINGGTLAINTNSNLNTSGITFTGGGVLGLDINYTVNATASAAVNFTSGAISITGTPTSRSYTLLRALSMTGGTPALTAPIADYEVQVVDLVTEKQLRLVSTVASYEAWALGNAFDADANGDGVKNGMAFLLGASNPTATVTEPVAIQSGGNLVISFNLLKPINRGTAVLSVEHSSDLGIADPWTTVLATDSNSGPTNGVTFVVTPGSGTTNAVQATINSAQGDGAGKLFGRLKCTSN